VGEGNKQGPTPAAKQPVRGGEGGGLGSGRKAQPKRPTGASSFIQAGADNSIPEYGSEVSGSQKAEAEKALAAFLSARVKKNWSVACFYLGSQQRGLMETLAKSSKAKVTGCRGALAIIATHTSSAELANAPSGAIDAFRVKGSKAFALFYGPHRHKYMMPMVLERGGWKVSQLAPVSYPVGAPTTLTR